MNSESGPFIRARKVKKKVHKLVPQLLWISLLIRSSVHVKIHAHFSISRHVFA